VSTPREKVATCSQAITHGQARRAPGPRGGRTWTVLMWVRPPSTLILNAAAPGCCSGAGPSATHHRCNPKGQWRVLHPRYLGDGVEHGTVGTRPEEGARAVLLHL
jgi:hypothetical protein